VEPIECGLIARGAHWRCDGCRRPLVLEQTAQLQDVGISALVEAARQSQQLGRQDGRLLIRKGFARVIAAKVARDAPDVGAAQRCQRQPMIGRLDEVWG
jgi:hypothetical protein